MADAVKKFSVTPLDRFAWTLRNFLPFDLRHGLSVQSYDGRLPSISHWDEYLSKHDVETVANWSVCLEHRYLGKSRIQDDDEKQSSRFVASAMACFRFLVPSRANGHHYLQLETMPTGDLSPFSYMHPTGHPVLETLEQLSPELNLSSLQRYVEWVDWIADFSKNGSLYRPLWISLNFSEKSYFEYYKPIRHVLRVMALEALFSDSKVYGLDALASRLLPMVGDSDLYEEYRSDLQRPPSIRVDRKLLTHILGLRNEIAHGRPVPEKWTRRDRLYGASGLTYADYLTEVVTALVRFVWLQILDKKLQNVFSHKERMIRFCKATPNLP